MDAGESLKRKLKGNNGFGDILLERFFGEIDKHPIIVGLLANIILLCSVILPWAWQSSFSVRDGDVSGSYEEIGAESISSIPILYLPFACLLIGIVALGLARVYPAELRVYKPWLYISILLFLITGIVLIFSLVDFARPFILFGEYSAWAGTFSTQGFHLGFIFAVIGTVLNVGIGLLPLAGRKARVHLVGFLGITTSIAILLSLSLPWFTTYISPLSLMSMFQNQILQRSFGGVVLLPFYVVAICGVFILMGGILEMVKVGSGESYIRRGGVGAVAMTALFIIFGGMLLPIGTGCWAALVFGIIAMASFRFYKSPFEEKKPVSLSIEEEEEARKLAR